MKLRLAIVGAGPAGIYAADILQKYERAFDVSIDLFDRLPAPTGWSDTVLRRTTPASKASSTRCVTFSTPAEFASSET